MHIKEPLLLIEKSSPCGGSGFPLSLSEWFFYMHHPTDRIAHTTAFVTPVVGHWLEQEIPNICLCDIYLTNLLNKPLLFHDWCNKGRGMCYPVCGMVHIKEPLLLIDKSSLCGGSGFPFSLSEWSFTICLMPYNRR